MAFNIFKWLFGKNGDSDEANAEGKVKLRDFLGEEVGECYAGMEIYIQKIIFWAIVRRIGSAVGAVEWKTFRQGKEIKSGEYWSWNFTPNMNESKQEFFTKIVAELYQHQEALVVETRSGDRFVAEGFSTEKHLNGDIYSDITSQGFQVPGRYKAEDVLHLTMQGDLTSGLLSGIAAMEGRLMKSAAAAYIRQQGTRGILEIDEIAEAQEGFEEEFADLMNDKFKKYFSAENAVLPLYKGYSFKENEGTGGSTKSSLTGTRDIKNMMDDIVEYTALAFGIPSNVAIGKNVTEEDFKEFMTSAVKSIVQTIETEINRKIYGQGRVTAGTYIKANMENVRYVDLFDAAGPIDKLIGSGAFCINDIRAKLGLPAINEEWANAHWMTKNYATMGEINQELGKEKEEENE